MIRVTVSGLPGSGTSTLVRLLVERLGVERVDGGTIFRAMAADRGMTLAEFGLLCEHDDSIDRALDDRLAARLVEGDVVLESRLAGWLAHRSPDPHGVLTVWVACDEYERARRCALRDGGSAGGNLSANRERERTERARYLSYYGIDLAAMTPYRLVLDSTASTPEQLADQIVAVLTGDNASA